MKLKRKIQRAIEKVYWSILVWSLKSWTNKYMDQWEKIKFDTEYGTIYVTISRMDQYPDSFDLIK
jgi:hypothetical protein